MEPLTVAISGGVGAAAGALTVYLIMRTREATEAPTSLPVKSGVKREIRRAEMEKARRELNAILLEKDLLSSALTRVYEAEVDRRISKQEREELAARYKKRLKEVEEKLGDAEITIEVGELERLREELVNLFEGKMRQIESRLDEARAKLDRLKGSARPLETLEEVEEEKMEKRRAKRSRAKTEEVEVDEKVKELREEVLEALARLEQMDIEG